ncbi:acyltransferase domain-containing protein [Amycolatopsis sp. NPDC052450]|uniref:acyltransferase domain-containing protein n=1 Tax=Amycolatopsis sp. NPDC052450 TaxID=3363937 RepID=UPI0037CB047A
MFFPFSAESPEQLAAEAATLADRADPLPALAAELAGRRHGSWRAVVVGEDPDAVTGRLRAVAAGQPATGAAVGEAVSAGNAVWVFSGHGSQWTGMGKALLDGEPAFAEEIDHLAPLIADEAGFSLHDALSGSAEGIEQVQPSLFAMQLGLAAAWRAHGAAPAAVIGHSMGETAAAVVAGALSTEDGVAVICRRSRLMRRVSGTGAMAMVALPWDTVETELADVPEVTVAAHSGPTSTVVAGGRDRVRTLVDRWAARDLMAKLVPVEVASHSPQVEPILADLSTELSALRPRPARVPVYSTVLPDPRSTAAFDAAYWTANLRRPVRFSAAVRAALDDGHRAFVEISPHPLLAHALRENAGAGKVAVLSSIRRGGDALLRFRTQVGALHCAGAPVRF